MNKQISRRNFLSGSAGLTFAFAVSPQASTSPARRSRRSSYAPNVWMTIATDGTITIVSPAAEMGQGSFTTLPAIIAEELDADWAKVRPILPPQWEEKKYGNPAYDGAFQTTASSSVKGYFKGLRMAGAQARRVLLDAAGGAVERAGGRALDRAERGRAQGVRPPHELWRDRRLRQAAGRASRRSTEKDLKSPANFRLHRQGRAARRRAVESHRRGEIRDRRRRFRTWSTPRCCSRLIPAARRRRSTMPRRARSPGITDIVTLPEGVGVVGTTVEATQAAKRLLKVTWSNAPGARHDSERALGEFAEIGRDKSRGGVVYDRVGDAKAAMAGAARVFRGEYRTRYLYHAQMEPLSATAAVSPDGSRPRSGPAPRARPTRSTRSRGF